jgi:hypothetical protein
VSAAHHPEPARVPIDEELALYANDVDVWHSPHDVVLDLYALGPRDVGEEERASLPVARVRLPPTMVLHMTQLLGDAIARRLGEERP